MARRYIHRSALGALDEAAQIAADKAIRIAGAPAADAFTVLKISNDLRLVSLLDYPRFFDDAFPSLLRSWAIDTSAGTVRYRTYEDSLTPPILHRKELLLTADHPSQAELQALTKAAEQIGLFDDPHRIGFKRAWEDLLANRGYRVVGHELVPIGNDETNDQEVPTEQVIGVARHLTALTRYGLSAPMQTLARFGLLDGSRNVFDYGCGRGDDVRGLCDNNIPASGWDPHFAPDSPKTGAQIVNLGFVLNVIENFAERIEALQGAYALTTELLVISVMLANQESIKGTPYADGVLTSRNTFQKYYAQGEFKAFVAEVLDEEPIPVAPGILYVFKDKAFEQRFMYGRQENRRNVLRLTHLSRPVKPARIDRATAKYEQHKSLLEQLWETSITLGRDPGREEVEGLDEITAHFGSLAAALRFIKSRKTDVDEVMEISRQSRIDDLTVFLAREQFEKRKPYRHLEPRLQLDFRVFFGDYRNATDAGRALLYSIANIEAIGNACHRASDHGIGWLEDSESLQVHTSMVEQLPPILRAYIACGTVLYGDVTSADLIKIHIRSAKLTLTRFDDFIGKPLPKMTQRVKLNLRVQDMQVFDYVSPYEPPYLYGKSRFINEEFANFPEQLAFEEALEKLNLCNFAGYGPPPAVFDELLMTRRYEIDSFSLVPRKIPPAPDDMCGANFTFRQLIECGDTWKKTRLENFPKEPASFTALRELARHIIDPVVDYFGMVELTYGFCSHSLAKKISGRIAPALDQHAAHERKRGGATICKRPGAAIDFLVADEDMEDVADWIIKNLPFDRLYFYGADRPIHVSYGPEQSRAAYRMEITKGGVRVPKPYTKALRQ